jgi:hypothetical protein
MIAILVERPNEFSSIDTGYSFLFSGSDRDARVSVQVVTDESVNIFRIVSVIEDVGFRFSRSVTLNEMLFGMRDIVNGLLGDLEPASALPRGLKIDEVEFLELFFIMKDHKPLIVISDGEKPVATFSGRNAFSEGRAYLENPEYSL